MVARIGQRRRIHYYVKEWREHRGLTLKQLGERLNVAENTIWRWENEPHRLNPNKIEGLANALQLADGDDLTRPPSARPSLDALLKDAPDDVFDDVVELARRMTRRAS